MAGRPALKRSSPRDIPEELPEELGALVFPTPDTASSVLLGDGAAPNVTLPGDVIRVPDRDLPRQAREGGWSVIIARSLSATLRRATLKHPPKLVVITGPAEPAALAELVAAGVRVLGPHARVRVPVAFDPSSSSGTIAASIDPDELDALVDARAEVAMAIAPTPNWLPAWAVGRLEIIGMVYAEHLDAGWTVLAEGNHVVVPLGVPPSGLDRADLSPSSDLDRATVAQLLERRTGPLYPAPRVIALVHRFAESMADAEAERSTESDGAAGPQRRRLWDQARRALPHLGARLGMSEPLPGLPLDVPAAAFLAQRALLRIQRSFALAAEEAPEPPTLDRASRERADEVLRASAETLSEHESKVVLRGYGFEITRQAVATSASGAASYAEQIGFPVVLKAVSPDLRRKQELGLVRLDLPTAASVRRAHAQIHERAEREAPTARIDGVIVAEMVEAGVEIRCGFVRAESGRAVIYAQPEAPGAALEPLLAYAPLDPMDALALADRALSRLPAPALRRSSDPTPRDLANVLLRLSGLHEAAGERVRSVELSPVRLLRSDRRWVVLDARIVQRPHLEGD